MEYDQRDFFTEIEDSDVQGFVVIETAEDGEPGSLSGEESYRIAEKWNRSDRDGGPVWITYWMPAQALDNRIAEGSCKHTTTMSEEQFRGVLNLAGVEHQTEVATV